MVSDFHRCKMMTITSFVDLAHIYMPILRMERRDLALRQNMSHFDPIVDLVMWRTQRVTYTRVAVKVCPRVIVNFFFIIETKPADTLIDYM